MSNTMIHRVLGMVIIAASLFVIGAAGNGILAGRRADGCSQTISFSVVLPNGAIDMGCSGDCPHEPLDEKVTRTRHLFIERLV